jgi:hypothetical protein
MVSSKWKNIRIGGITMSILYYDNTCTDGLTLEEVTKIRESALNLVYQNMHPRYHYAVVDLFKAANALMNEMKLQEKNSFHFSDNQEQEG